MNRCGRTYSLFDFVLKFLFKNKSTRREKFLEEKNLEFEKKRKEEICKILNEIREVKKDLKCANSEFNCHTETDLIESSVYLIRALEKKLNFLLKEARKKNIKYDEEVVSLVN